MFRKIFRYILKITQPVVFSQAVLEAIKNSRLEAIRLHNDRIGAEHFLLGIFLIQNTKLQLILEGDFKIDINEFKIFLESLIKQDYPNSEKEITGNMPLTKEAERIIRLVIDEEKIWRNNNIMDLEHVFLSFLRNCFSLDRYEFLINAGVNKETFLTALKNQSSIV